MSQSQKKRRTDDALWKGLLENVFDDFLTFFFPNADEVFDLKKGFVYLDKELADLFPNEEGKTPKHVDKLVKVFTKSGKEKWVLVHVEVQGQKDEDFAFRMFTYYYRILDRYRKPVTAIAILTDSNKNFHPTTHEYSFMGTENTFKFNTYKVLDQDEHKLKENDNPFAIAILTVLIALKGNRLKDGTLFDLEYKLLRNLYRRAIPKNKTDGLLLFLQLYVHFENTDYNLKFEKVIEELTEKNITMGIREFVLDRAKKEGIGERNMDFTKSLISETEFDDVKIAKMVGVDVEFVQEIRNMITTQKE